MKIIFLGTNGWYDTETGNTTCIFLDTEKYSLILDAGNGIHKLDKYIDFKKPAFLFLSHFHLDHIIGLHILTKFKFKKELRIFGQKEVKKTLNQFVNQPFTVPISQLPFEVRIEEISKKTSLPFSVEVKYLIHSSPVLGYRFELENKKIAYCTDTGDCKNLRELAKDVDLLITECSLKSGQKINPEWPHLTPELAAEIAKKSNVKKLILTHFDSAIYKTFKERKEAERIAKSIFKNTTSAIDGLVIKL